MECGIWNRIQNSQPRIKDGLRSDLGFERSHLGEVVHPEKTTYLSKFASSLLLFLPPKALHLTAIRLNKNISWLCTVPRPDNPSPLKQVHHAGCASVSEP